MQRSAAREVSVKVRACAVADIVHNGNAAEAEQRDDIAGGKSPGPALPEVARVVELLPDAAPVRAEGNDLYIGIVRRFNARRGDNFDKAGGTMRSSAASSSME